MVKSYDRYEYEKTFGLVVSPSSNILCGAYQDRAGLAFVPALSAITVWDLKRGEELFSLSDSKCQAEITVLCKCDANDEIIASGHADGSIAVWDLKSRTPFVLFHGHSAAISALVFDSSGTRLASASIDTSITLWDIISEKGLFTLNGHQDQVTALTIIDGAELDKSSSGFLISSGKDSFLKIWDLELRHCIETRVAHADECWAMCVDQAKEVVATSGRDGEIKIWDLNMSSESKLSPRCSLQRAVRNRAFSLIFDTSGQHLACHGNDRSVEVWRKRGDDEVTRAAHRRKKKHKTEDTDNDKSIASFTLYTSFHATAKIRSLAWNSDGAHRRSLVLSLAANSLEAYKDEGRKSTTADTQNVEFVKYLSLDFQSHRSDVRCLVLSQDETLLATASLDAVKLWNTKSWSCVRSMDCNSVLCMRFLPNNQQLIVGTKSGSLEVLDLATATSVYQHKAHDGSIWSLTFFSDNSSFATGGADHITRVWSLKSPVTRAPENGGTFKIDIKVQKIIKLTDEVLSVCGSPDGRLLAVATMDTTVKTFFIDSSKFFLALYGHKLPVTTMDIAHDNKLIITGSADKTVKIWGLDFGDCHRSILAHDDSIMQVQFIPQSRVFFSCSKDGLLKQWDANNFENITTLRGHKAGLLALTVGSSADFVVSSSRDKSLRVWRRSGDQVFTEEEREKELEALYDSNTAHQEVNLDNEDEVTRPSNPAIAMSSADKFLETLQQCVDDRHATLAAVEGGDTRMERDPIFLAHNNVSAEDYLLSVVESLNITQMLDILMIMPYGAVLDFLKFLPLWTKGANISATCTMLSHILQTYHKHMAADERMGPILSAMKTEIMPALRRHKNRLGYNMAAFKSLKRSQEEIGNGVGSAIAFHVQ